MNVRWCYTGRDCEARSIFQPGLNIVIYAVGVDVLHLTFMSFLSLPDFIRHTVRARPASCCITRFISHDSALHIGAQCKPRLRGEE